MKMRYVICSITWSGFDSPPDQKVVPDRVDLVAQLARQHPPLLLRGKLAMRHPAGNVSDVLVVSGGDAL